jgi:hypothetical protein
MAFWFWFINLSPRKSFNCYALTKVIKFYDLKFRTSINCYCSQSNWLVHVVQHQIFFLPSSSPLNSSRPCLSMSPSRRLSPRCFSRRPQCDLKMGSPWASNRFHCLRISPPMLFVPHPLRWHYQTRFTSYETKMLSSCGTKSVFPSCVRKKMIELEEDTAAKL